MSNHPLRDWIPYRFQPADALPNCRWLYTAGQRFDAPFFDETIQQCQQHACNSGRFRVESTLDGVISLTETVPALEPTAFIFHVSRCGSTLLSQLLSLNEQYIVLSEVPLLDDVLRLPEQTRVSPATRDALFQAVVRLLGHRRRGNETHLFVKLDSWHILFYETIRRLYPAVPLVFVYRRPDAVVASHRSRPGIQAVPGLLPAHWFGLDPADAVHMRSEEYTAHVIDCYLARFQTIAASDNLVSLLPYQPDGLAMMRQLTEQLNLVLPEGDWAAIRQRSGFHAKYPGQVFGQERPLTAVPDYLSSAMKRFSELANASSMPAI